MRKDLINFLWLPSFMTTFLIIKNFLPNYRRMDDLSYFVEGKNVYYSLILNFPNLGEAIYFAKGIHLGYYLYNGFLTEVFNFTYNDINYLNCCLIALVLPKLQTYVGKSFIVPLYFSPVIFSFPIFLNIKDGLLLALTIIFIDQVKKQSSIIRNTVLGVVMIAIFSMRFYLPFILLIWIFLSKMIIYRNINAKFLFILVGSVTIIELTMPSQFLRIFDIDYVDTAQRVLKMFISPLPWTLLDEYYFLILASVLGVIRFPLIIIGCVVIIIKKDDRLKELLLLCIICVLFMSISPDISGPRQRVFFEPVLSLIGIIGFYGLLKSLAYRSHH